VFLTLLHDLGIDLPAFGDSTGAFDLNKVQETTL
jgi:hypothetical protein